MKHYTFPLHRMRARWPEPSIVEAIRTHTGLAVSTPRCMTERWPPWSRQLVQEPMSAMGARADVPRFTRSLRHYVEHTDGDGGEMFQAVCKTWLEGTKSKSPKVQ